MLLAPGVKARVARRSLRARCSSSSTSCFEQSSSGSDSLLCHPGQAELKGSLDCCLITLSFTNSPGVFLLQLRGYCLRLCQLPQADLREGRLPDGVLLSLQTDMASQPNLRHGPPAKGTDAPSTDQAHVRPQLRTGIRAGYGFTRFLITQCCSYAREAEKEPPVCKNPLPSKQGSVSALWGTLLRGTAEGLRQPRVRTAGKLRVISPSRVC